MAGETVSPRGEDEARAAPAPSAGILHPFTRALYERIDAQRVRVTLGGKSGVFAPDGRWLEGALKEADPQLCGWLGGPRMVHHRLLVPASE
jgi:hypothetical protein